MDLLVSLSTSVAYISSIAMMAIDVRTPRAVVGSESSFQTMTYFDSSVFLIFFILMGRVLEGRARVKVRDHASSPVV
jgi:Cu+-exporting ATPase